MYRHRELLTSLLASAMLTTSMLPSQGIGSLASVVDPSAAGRVMTAAFSRMPDGGWSMPDIDMISAQSVAPVIAVNLTVAAEPIITKERIRLLYDRALLNPKTSNVTAVIAVPTGFSNDRIQVKQLGEKTETLEHRFAAPITPNGKFLVGVIKDGVITAYVCDMEGKLLAAGVLVDQVFTSMTLEAAKAGFEASLRYWNTSILPPPPTNA